MIGTVISTPPGGEEALRRALLQRVADRLAFARAIVEDEVRADTLVPTPGWRCCWVSFSWPTKPPYRYPMHRYVHQICGDDCRHWHHYSEVLLA